MIIGFLGKKGIGKDTSAKLLIEQYDFTRYAFGDPVKDVVKTMFCLSDEQLHGNKKEEVDPRWNVTPRRLFQIVGTNFAQYWLLLQLPEMEEKVKMKHFWVKRFDMWLEDNLDKNIVVTDVRFKHEINSIKSKNGIIIKLINSNLNEAKDNHISEKEIDTINSKDIDYTIDNNASIDILYQKINKIMNELELEKKNEFLGDESDIWGY